MRLLLFLDVFSFQNILIYCQSLICLFKIIFFVINIIWQLILKLNN